MCLGDNDYRDDECDSYKHCEQACAYSYSFITYQKTYPIVNIFSIYISIFESVS